MKGGREEGRKGGKKKKEKEGTSDTAMFPLARDRTEKESFFTHFYESSGRMT